MTHSQIMSTYPVENNLDTSGIFAFFKTFLKHFQCKLSHLFPMSLLFYLMFSAVNTYLLRNFYFKCSYHTQILPVILVNMKIHDVLSRAVSVQLLGEVANLALASQQGFQFSINFGVENYM